MNTKDKNQKTNEMKIPEAVIERLPRYYRNLRELVGNDILRVSSTELSKIMGFSQSQIRKDFSYISKISKIGQQGYGYNCKDLYNALGEAIGIKQNYSAIIVGDNADACKTVATFPCFLSRGVTLKKIFSSADTDLLGKYIAENGITIAVLICDRSVIKNVLACLVGNGIKGIWNMTGTDIPQIDGISTVSFNPADSLLQLCTEINSTNRN